MRSYGFQSSVGNQSAESFMHLEIEEFVIMMGMGRAMATSFMINGLKELTQNSSIPEAAITILVCLLCFIKLRCATGFLNIAGDAGCATDLCRPNNCSSVCATTCKTQNQNELCSSIEQPPCELNE